MGYGQTQWYKELKASQPNCIYCDEKLTDETFTVDHIELASLGGANSQKNCKPCCKFCNNLRGNMEYNEFTTLYPKEKLLKLKEYTLNNQDINGVLVMKESIETLDIIRLNLNKLIERKNEIYKLTIAYKELSNKVRNEIAYSKNLNASEGYKLYVKQREIDRQYLRYKNETKFLNKYTEDLEKLIKITESMNTSMNQSTIDNALTKAIPTLEEDLETVLNNTIDNIISTIKIEPKNQKAIKQSKNYQYRDETDKKQKYTSLSLVWKIIDDDIKNKVLRCSVRK